MPIEARPSRTAATSVSQAASPSTTSPRPATMSNQYQPPSPNVVTGRSTCTTAPSPENDSDATRWGTPCAVERYTSSVPDPLSVARRRMRSTTVQCCQ
jgi:hypothetical protein